MPAGSGDGDLVDLYRRLLAPIAESFGPALILVSAGFDAHARDPIGGLELTERGFAALCGVVRDLADRLCGGRLALFLEGGYDHQALAESVHACARVLAGDDPPPVPEASERGAALREIFRIHHARYWPALARARG